MDFRSLTRRELQALCKRNKIPANITNVAMADALAALPLVEGIDEFLNGEGSGVPESPMREEVACSENPRTALRTSTRRKTVKDEPKSSQPMTRTRRAATARCTEESENMDLNVALTTPSLPTGRRRASAATSACKKVDFQMTVEAGKEDNDLDQEKNVIEKTPAEPKSQKKVAAASTRKRTETQNNGATEQRVYSTRRSVRLLEKNMESLSLDDGKMEPVAVHMSFDEMPNSTGPMEEEDTNVEIESKVTDESESKSDDVQEKNEMESEVNLPEAEPEMSPDSSIDSAENLVPNSCDDSKTDDDNLDVKCFSEVEVSEEATKDDDDVVEISAEEINDSEELSAPTEVPEEESPSDNDDAMEISDEKANDSEELFLPIEVPEEAPNDNDDAVEISDEKVNDSEQLSVPTEVPEEASKDNDEFVEISDEKVNDSEQLSVPTKIPEEASKDNDDFVEIFDEKVNDSEQLSMPTVVREEAPQDNDDFVEISDEKVNDFEQLSVPTEVPEEAPKDNDDAVEISDEKVNDPDEPSLPDDDVVVDVTEVVHNLANVEEVEYLDDFEEEEEEGDKKETETLPVEASKDVNDSSSEPKIPNDINFEKVDVVVSVEEIPTLGTQFPRPTVAAAKSPLKEQAIIGLLMDEDDHDDEGEGEEKEKVEEGSFQRQIERDDMSLRQLKKMFKEKLILSKKKMDNAKVGEKMRTALQPVPENRMTMEELEKRF